jgi:uncharacterized membrane protein (DUF485 family)
MLINGYNKFMKKSPKERFLLVIGLLFFLLYFILGMIVIFWKDFPILMKTNYRIAFGVILIVYSFLRFLRFFNSNKE